MRHRNKGSDRLKSSTETCTKWAQNVQLFVWTLLKKLPPPLTVFIRPQFSHYNSMNPINKLFLPSYGSVFFWFFFSQNCCRQNRVSIVSCASQVNMWTAPYRQWTDNVHLRKIVLYLKFSFALSTSSQKEFGRLQKEWKNVERIWKTGKAYETNKKKF